MGAITRVAGTTGISASGGDGGLATDALLFSPQAVAVTADGGFLIADSGNHVVRKVSADGLITCIAGTPAPRAAAGTVAWPPTPSSAGRSRWR